MRRKLTIPLLAILFIAAGLSALSATAAPPDDDPFPPAITTGQHSSGATMVLVPAGDFIMGSAADDRLALPREQPQRTVYLDAFWIDQDEVTNAQYNRCVAAGACQPGQYAGDERYNADDQPVVGVDWEQATTFCAWTGRALPTEAQWEKAARGLNGQSYAWGNDPVPTADISPFGLRGTANQVWEWTADWRDEAYYRYAPTVNPTGPAEGRLRAVRGGAWNYLPPDSRAASRTALPPAYAPPILSFRCVAPADAAIEPMTMELAALAEASPLSAPAMPEAQVMTAVAEDGGPQNFWFEGWIPWLFPLRIPTEVSKLWPRPPAPGQSAAPVTGQSSPRLIAMEAGSTITVTTTADDYTANGNCTLREAIDAADLDAAVDACQAGSGDDTIILPAGVYSLTLSGVEDDNESGDLDVVSTLTILGDGPDTTIIHANGQERVFDAEVGSTLIISGVTVTGGNAWLENSYPDGGGISARGALVLTNTVISHNQGRFGGGLDLAGSGPYHLADSEINHNTAQIAGGGLYNQGWLKMTNSLIQANTVTATDSYGGGLENEGGVVWLDDVTVQENSAGFNGGGIENYRGVITLTNSALLTNTLVATDSYGGGLSNYEGKLATLDTVLVQGNRAGQFGAGIDNSWGAEYGGKLDIYNSAILSNTTTFTESNGAGLAVYSSTVTLLEDTVVQGNRAGWGGGGISVMEFSLITLRDSTISHNTTGDEGGFGGGLMLWASLGTLENTDLEYNSAGQYGGGLVLAGAEVLMNGGRIAHNQAVADSLGGGLMNLDSYAVLNSVTIEANQADTGGGLANLDSKSVISGSIITGNQATGSGSLLLDIDGGLGGGLFSTGARNAAQIDLTGVTLSGNSATTAGGAVSLAAGDGGSSLFFLDNNSVASDNSCHNPNAVLNVGDNFTDDSGTCVQSRRYIYLPVVIK